MGRRREEEYKQKENNKQAYKRERRSGWKEMSERGERVIQGCRRGKYRATFALKYNTRESRVCMLKDSLASAFSYLQWVCVGLHLYEGGDEEREEGKHHFPKL